MHNYFLPWTQSQLNRDAIVQKERGFIHSLSLLFSTEERWERLWKKKMMYCMQEGAEGKKSKISMFSFVPFSPLPRPFLFPLFKEESCRHFEETTSPALACKCSPSSHLFQPRGQLQNFEWGPLIVCAPLLTACFLLMLREAEGHISFTHLRGWSDRPRRLTEVRRWKMVARTEKVFEKSLWMKIMLQDNFYWKSPLFPISKHRPPMHTCTLMCLCD